MRSPDNIKALVALKPDYLGLIFYPKSKRFVEDTMAEGILEQIPDSINKVGVFVNETSTEILRKKQAFKLDFIQLHGTESVSFCAEIKQMGIPVIKAFGIDDSFRFESLNAYENCCDYFLFDTKTSDYGGSGKKFNWNILSNYTGSKAIFLSGGIGPNDIDDIRSINGLTVHAIDVNSKFEISPAVKNIDALSSFINVIRLNK